MRALIRRCHADAVRFAGPAQNSATKNFKSKPAHSAEALSQTRDGSVGQAQTWRNLFQNKFAIRELMAAVLGLVREGDQIRQPNSSMENVSGFRS
jgi:cytochrome c551/c552